eukprot:m.260502 g.260502  ORF g.260502 m.260502 type:complete len:70 (+) comp15562_c0_seq4:3120-3329(+)
MRKTALHRGYFVALFNLNSTSSLKSIFTANPMHTITISVQSTSPPPIPQRSDSRRFLQASIKSASGFAC